MTGAMGRNRLTMKQESGAILRVAHTERTAKSYAILETELDTVSLLNGPSVLFYSVAGALFTFALGMLMQAVLQEYTSPESWGIIIVVCPTLAVLASASLVVAVWAHLKRRSLVDTMKRDSKEL